MAAVRYVDAYPPHGGGDDVDIMMRASVLTGSQILALDVSVPCP